MRLYPNLRRGLRRSELARPRGLTAVLRAFVLGPLRYMC